MRSFTENTVFTQAVSFVNQTGKHLFLTGKAGTGKTTFLKYIKEHSFKKLAVAAPTGVAAINAGGITLHSLFQLPLGPYLPTANNNWEVFDGRVNNQHSLFKNLHLSSAKRQLLQELELLIIDEVSMLRADMLDMVDAVLRQVRRRPELPFGGVQMLYIGDLYQLPPVTKNEEWDALKAYYQSPFFFHAQVVQQAPPVFIELKTIYRQSDEAFIHILNNIRNNQCTYTDLEQLHEHYNPRFVPPKEDNYIVLTSHNDKADAMNRRELQKLPGPAHTFKAVITGEFNDRSYPAEEVLYLKEGAQVMFLKNDKGEHRRYFNGKIGIVQRIVEDKIYILFPGSKEELELEQETWQNIRYNYNKEKDKIEEEELGTFSQYPVRLAWAITIHKSQGLTFDKAIIDAGASFAPGQVYVALSRLTNLQGLVLYSRIHSHCIRTDERVVEFAKNEWREDLLQEVLEKERHEFVRQSLLKGFDWQRITERIQQHIEEWNKRDLPHKADYMTWAIQWQRELINVRAIAVKFTRQLEQLYISAGGAYGQLHQRTQAAVEYFSKSIDEQLLALLDRHFGEARKEKKIKKYLDALLELKKAVLRQKQVLHHTLQLAEGLYQSSDDLLQRAQNVHQPDPIVMKEEETAVVASKPVKGETQRLSLQMYRGGKSLSDIAQERHLTLSTIEGHLASFITTGEVAVHEVITPVKLEKVWELLGKEENIPPLGALKSRLGDEFSYGEIKAAVIYWEKEKNGK